MGRILLVFIVRKISGYHIDSNLLTENIPVVYNYHREDVINLFGEIIKKERLKSGLSLREFCRKISYDASNWSKIERGKYSPPQDEETLKAIADVLNIDINSMAWKEIADKAHIDAGIIPPDILSDEEIVKSLPLFFRTLRSEKPTEDELDSLIENIRREGI